MCVWNRVYYALQAANWIKAQNWNNCYIKHGLMISQRMLLILKGNACCVASTQAGSRLKLISCQLSVWVCWFFFNSCNFKNKNWVRAKLPEGSFSGWGPLQELLVNTDIALPYTRRHTALWIEVVLAAQGPEGSAAMAILLHNSILFSPCLLTSVSRHAGKKVQIILLHTTGPRLTSGIVGENTYNYVFIRAKILENKDLTSSSRVCLPEWL